MGGDLVLWQYVTFIVAVSTSSTLSIIGSSTIIFMILNDCNKVYHRIMLMISIGDLVLSTSNLVHGFLLPVDKTDSPLAIGNDGTCSVMGFVLNASLLFVSIYSAFISVNFYLQIRHRWTDEQVSKRLEFVVHIVAFLISLSIPTIGVFTQSMSPSYESGLCLMTTYPRGCTDDDTLECERGEFGATYLAPTVSALIYAFGLAGFYCTIALYCKVRGAIAANQRHLDAAFQGIDKRQQERMSRVSRQCSLYALAYLNTILWPAAVQIVFRAIDAEGRRGEPGLYILRLAAMLCFPLQGMLNFLVFISPKYQLWRQAMPYEPWTYVLHCAMKESNPPTRPPTHNNENTTKNRSSKRKSPLSAEAALIQNRIPVSVIKQLQRRQRRDQLDEIVTRTDSVVPTSTLQRSCQDDNDDDNDDNDDDNHDDNHDAPASWSARTTPVGGIVKLRIVHEAVPSDDGQHGTRDESDLSDDSSGAIEDNDDDVEDSDEEDYCVSGGVPDCV